MIKETGVSILEVLEIEALKSCEIVAGKSGFNNIITRVNIMADLEILNWIEEGEFLLTTAIHFSNISVEDQIELLKGMKEKGVEAIAIKIKPYIKKLSDDVIQFADEIGLPIIDLDYKISFADVMEPILKKIFEKQSNIIRRVEKAQNNVMDTLLKGGTVIKIIDTLSKSLNNPLMIKDYYFDDIICSKLNYEEYSKYDNEIFQYLNKKNIETKENKTKKYSILIADVKHEVYMIPVVARSSVYGNLMLIDINKSITQFDIKILESISSIIALELLKKISIQEVENKYQIEFFDGLVSKDKNIKSKAVERSAYYKFDKNADYSTYTISLNNKDETKSLESLNRDISQIVYLVDNYCTTKKLSFLVANKKSKVNIVVMFKDRETSHNDAIKLSREFENLISTKIRSIDFVIGVGRVFNGIHNMHKSLKDSLNAVKASEYYTDDTIIEFENLGIFKIFCNDDLKDELLDYYSSILEPLVKYDQKKDTELIKTLEIYFESNGNLKKMSEKLFTHYNTVLYRVNRIQEITSCNLDNEKDRYGLQTSIKILRMFGINK